MNKLFDLHFPKEEIITEQCEHDFVEDGAYFCLKCGRKEQLLVERNYDYYEKPIIKSLPYKSVNHFKEKINQLCAFENIIISKDVLDLCRDCKDHEEIKLLLQKHKLKKYYEHVYSIQKHLGKPIAYLEKYEIDKLVYLFNMFINVYNKYKKLSNVINYHYILSKLLPLIHRENVIPFLYKLKNFRKTREHDKIIKLIFIELKWD